MNGVAGRVDEPGALAAERFRKQEPRLPRDSQRRRVELHELEIRHGRARAIRHRHAVAGRHWRIRRIAEYVAGAAGREQHQVCRRDAHRAVLVKNPRAGAARVVDDELDGARVIGRANAGERRGAEPQDAPDLAARRVARMEHAPRAVRALDRQRRRAVSLAIERRAPCHQLADVTRPFFDEHLHGARVAEAISRGHRVGRVERRRIPGTDRRGDAALRVARIPLPRLRLREDEHGARASQLHGRPETRDTATDDEEVRVKIHALVRSCYPTIRYSRDSDLPTDANRLHVHVPSGAYPIEIVAGAARRIGAMVDALDAPKRRFIVSNPTVWRLHGDALADLTREEPILLPDGERFKNLATVGRIYDALIQRRRRSRDHASSRSAAASWGTSRDLPPRRSCGAFPSCRCRQRCWRRWTARSAERSASIMPRARISSARTISPLP